MSERTLDVICLGRAAVDFYAEQIGSRLEDVQSFAKYLGGSSANIATGTARQGLRSAMLTRVGDEHMGRFVRETLASEGVDVSHVVTDPQRLTALVVLGIKDRDTFPLIFYRENCADMAVSADDFDAEFIANSKALLITGTHFSTAGTYAASRAAIDYAREAGTKVIVDVDYRPVLWGLTGHGLGEERFVAADEVTSHLQTIVPLCDLIVGTEEEIHICGGSTETIAALKNIRAISGATLVTKRGPAGCSIFPGDIPEHLDEGITVSGVNVAVLNVLGAGDAFMSGFLRGWINEEPLEQCGRYANACGAIVVSRHGCTPAMPSKPELDDYLQRVAEVPRPDLDVRLGHLHRVTTRKHEWKELYILAFDHRSQFESLAAAAGAERRSITRFKSLICRAAERARAAHALEGRCGVLVDGRYGESILEHLTGSGWWLGRPVERPGSRPLAFEAGANVGLALRSWPQEQVVKCLVYYHPDDERSLREAQESELQALHQACVLTDHELLLELIVPTDRVSDERTVCRAMEQIYDRGAHPDWWKLQPPDRTAWDRIARLLDQRDPHCRGVLLLGLEAPEAELAAGFRAAADQPWCTGFAVGRTVFAATAKAWFAEELEDEGAIQQMADKYLRLIELWQSRAL